MTSNKPITAEEANEIIDALELGIPHVQHGELTDGFMREWILTITSRLLELEKTNGQ